MFFQDGTVYKVALSIKPATRKLPETLNEEQEFLDNGGQIEQGWQCVIL